MVSSKGEHSAYSIVSIWCNFRASLVAFWSDGSGDNRSEAHSRVVFALCLQWIPVREIAMTNRRRTAATTMTTKQGR